MPRSRLVTLAASILACTAVLMSSLILVAQAALPVVSAPKLISELAIDEAPNNQAFPSIAYGSGSYMTVWQDGRTNEAAIWGMVTSTPGAPSGDMSFLVAPRGTAPEIASDGTNYLVVWEQDQDVYARLVGPSGAPLGAAFPIEATIGTQQGNPDVAFNGTNYLVAWASDNLSGDSDIFAVRISPAGTMLESSPIVVSAAADDQDLPAVASNGTHYFVAWADRRTGTEDDVYGTKVSSAGVVTSPTGVALATTSDLEYQPALASNGNGYLLTWNAATDTGDTGVKGNRLDSVGAKQLGTDLVIAPSATGISQAWDIAFDGNRYGVLWRHWQSGHPETSKLRLTRVTSAGVLVDADGIVVADNDLSEKGALASDRGATSAQPDQGTGFVAAYGEQALATRQIENDGTLPGIEHIISLAPREQTDGGLASNGEQLEATWVETVDSLFQVFVGGISLAGDPLDGEGAPVEATVYPQRNARVASDGNNFLVVWEDYRNQAGQPEIRGLRLDDAGQALGGTFEISTADTRGSNPQVASRGEDYLVVWKHDAGNGDGQDVVGKLVSSTGDLGAPLEIGMGPELQSDVAVAADSSRYLVTWYDEAISDDAEANSALVVPDGAPIVHSPQPLTSNSIYPNQVHVAGAKTGFFVVWTEDRTDNGDPYNLWGVRVGHDGTPGPDSVIADTPGTDEDDPVIEFDGTNLVLTYTDANDPHDSLGYRLGMDGDPVDGEPFVSAPGGSTILDAASPKPGVVSFLSLRRGTPAEGQVFRLYSSSLDSRIANTLKLKKPKSPVTLTKDVRVAWTAPVDSADVRYRSAASNSGFGGYKVWKKATRAAGATFHGKPGRTYCWQVRARNGAGYFSPYGQEKCTAIPLDDRALKVTGPWVRGKMKGAFLGTTSLSAKKGAALKTDVRATRLALVASTCASCGKVKVTLGGKLLAKINLHSSRSRKKVILPIASFKRARSGALKIIVASEKPVIVDGLAVGAAP